jgi:Zn-dependent peptidase ImmA (M78 family)/DNA-binding XRE family transcriptional regulator
MTTNLNGEMLALAREARGLTQRALAEQLTISQAQLARLERSKSTVSNELLALICETLKRPPSFFCWEERRYSASCIHHRKLECVSLRELRAIQAQVDIARMQSARLLKYTEVETSYSFHRLDLPKLGSPQEAARRLRALWQLPMGPVRNVVDSIESAGGVVFRCPFGGIRVDGVSQWPLDTAALPPVFFVHDSAPGDRQRWTLAHEIGHVVLHHLPTDDPEVEANRFAGEFLMPANEIGPELKNLTLPKAAALKSYWKVSMMAIIRWAKYLGIVTANQYEYLGKQMGARGYRLCEPVPIPAEEPQLLQEMQAVLKREGGRSADAMSEYLGLPVEEYREVFRSGFPGLRLVS